LIRLRHVLPKAYPCIPTWTVPATLLNRVWIAASILHFGRKVLITEQALLQGKRTETRVRRPLRSMINCKFKVSVVYTPKKELIDSLTFCHTRNHPALMQMRSFTFFACVFLVSTVNGQSFLSSFHSRLPRSRHDYIRDVIVETQCRCGPNRCFIKGDTTSDVTASIIQPASLATGPTKKIYKSARACTCVNGTCNTGVGGLLRRMEHRYMHAIAIHNETRDGTPWTEIPDFGYERDLPVFVGALSFMSPRSLEAGLQNWKDTFFSPRVAPQFKGFFLHLNNRSSADDAVAETFVKDIADRGVPVKVSGGSSNENVGKVIASQCRLAEKSPHSHPRGENVMLWLEKDWHWNVAMYGLNVLNDRINSAREILQRGVVKLNMRPVGAPSPTLSWPCRGQNVTWTCAPGFLMHNMNSPMFIRCDWFLRYYEPYALFDEPVMLAHGRTGKKRKYFDWEEAGQDGRIEWVNSNWILGASQEKGLFKHVEVNEDAMYRR